MTNDFRLSEIYTSVQGEGPRTGQMTQFVRFAGCNLRCPGWPCDTQYAIDPDKYRSEWKRMTVEALIDEVEPFPDMITLTGGEPFLQPNDSLKKFVEEFVQRGYTIECFSNGTLEYPEWAFEYINFIMDWKLPGAGEDFGLHKNWQTARSKNVVNLKPTDAVKFVVKNQDDLKAARSAWEAIDLVKGQPEPYVGLVWGSELTNQDLVDYIIKYELPWSLNVQLHKHIWPAEERGV